MTDKNTSSTGPRSRSRRNFLQTTAAAAAVSSFGISLGAQEGRSFKIGIVGCGGRGTGAGKNALEAAKNLGDKAEIVAVADLFKDRAERARRGFKVKKEHAFVGWDAAEKLLELELDYVILATPPHFRPAQFEAAIKASKHVFTEKPVGVDAPGIRQFVAAGEAAKAKGLSVAAGTQRRHEKKYIECQKRVADGAIGTITNGRAYWNMGGLWTAKKEEGWSDMEWQIRDWLYFTWLSGDHIVEQHVHNLDVINWFLGRWPTRVRGMGGRQVRKGKPEYGNIFDHFSTEVIYDSVDPAKFPDVRVQSMCRQINGCWNDVSEFVVGTEGSTNCRDKIWGAKGWGFEGGQVGPYVQEHMNLMTSIKEGKGTLNEAENVAKSTFTAILCRESVYTGREIKWNDLWKSDTRLGPKEYVFGDLPIPPVAQVGKPM